jgi:hypothetical protein
MQGPDVSKSAHCVSKMHIEKIVLEKLAVTLLEKAEDCFDLAARQKDLAVKHHEIASIERKNAERQHALAVEQDSNADKLDASAAKLATMGHELAARAVAIKGDTFVVQRGPK